MSCMGTASHAASYVTFDLQDCPYTNVSAINVKGDVAGECEGDFGSYGFVRLADGTIQTFDIEGNQSSAANDLNRNGGAVGFYYSDRDGYAHGFLRRPGGHVQHLKIR